MFVDIYAIQNMPPANVNRDDTGAPKTAWYGGALRARVSSQAWKRAMRKEFAKQLPEGSLGVRTRLAVKLIAEKIVELRPDIAETADALAEAVLATTGVKPAASDRAGAEKDGGEIVTSYLLYIAQREIESLAKVAIRWNDDGCNAKKPDKVMKKEVAEAFTGTQAIDVALFGRMLADAPSLNTDAAAQVAHAISVDRIVQEYDYFTAIDDCAADDNAGAGMIGTVGFNSSTLYRYATVDVASLEKQLGGTEAAAKATAAFVRAFACSMPTGKQNTFANRTLPNAVLVSIRNNQPINAVSAFECPVAASADESVSTAAARLLGKKVSDIESAYDEKALKAWNVVDGPSIKELDSISANTTLGGLSGELESELTALLGQEQE